MIGGLFYLHWKYAFFIIVVLPILSIPLIQFARKIRKASKEICSIFAMHHVKKNKSDNRYKFNKTAISLLIILTFVFAIFPMIFGIIATVVKMIQKKKTVKSKQMWKVMK